MRNAVATTCSHLDGIKDLVPSEDGCHECLQAGDSWMHLRMCQTCGHIGCCDNSKGKHATKHHQSSGHPLIRSFEPRENWFWCYSDELFFELEGADPSPSHS